MSLKDMFKNYIVIIITALIFSFWIGFFATENIYNQQCTTYSIDVESSKINHPGINADFFLDALRKADGTYSYSSVKPKQFFDNDDIVISQENNKITITIKAKYFIGSEESVISYSSEERFVKVLKKVMLFHDKEAIVSSAKTASYFTPYKIGIISLAVGFSITMVAFLFIRKKLTSIDEMIYDNKEFFKTPFNKGFWIKAIDEIRNLKVFNMCFISILFALQLSLKLIRIPSGFSNLGLGITYLIFAYICLIYGPIWGLIIGFGSDVIGFMMKPDNVFHIGYTVQAMLTGFVYGACLYKTDLRFSKVLVARIIVNILLNAIYGSFLYASIANLNSDATLAYFYAVMLPKNIIYLIPQSLLLYGFLKLSVPLLISKKILSKKVIH